LDCEGSHLLVPELSVEFFQGDRVAGLIPRGIGLGDVFGILSRAERLYQRFWDDGGNTLAPMVK
jgi:hypothetical protein